MVVVLLTVDEDVVAVFVVLLALDVGVFVVFFVVFCGVMIDLISDELNAQYDG